MDKKTQNKLKKIRQKIDNLDNKLLKILAKRFDYSKRIAPLKIDANIQDADREETLKKQWQKKSNKLNLNPNFTQNILELILTESKIVQKNIKQ